MEHSSGIWIKVSDGKDIPHGGVRIIFPKGLPLLLIRKGNEVMALSNRCPHMGCPLSGGSLEGDVIRCPCHDWAFNIRTGKSVQAEEIKVATYQVRTENGSVFVKLEV